MGKVNRQILPKATVITKKNVTKIESTAINFSNFFNEVAPNLAHNGFI